MNCKTCGKELKKDAKFCTECGTKVDVVTKTTETKTETKTASETITTTNVPISNSKGTASLVLGIISLVLCPPLFLALSITGLILGIAQQGKNGVKTAGIVINAVAIGLGVLGWLFISLFIVAIVQSENGGDYYESVEDSNGNSNIIDYGYDEDYEGLNNYLDQYYDMD